jgi:hypothetical protein
MANWLYLSPAGAGGNVIDVVPKPFASTQAAWPPRFPLPAVKVQLVQPVSMVKVTDWPFSPVQEACDAWRQGLSSWHAVSGTQLGREALHGVLLQSKLQFDALEVTRLQPHGPVINAAAGELKLWMTTGAAHATAPTAAALLIKDRRSIPPFSVGSISMSSAIATYLHSPAPTAVEIRVPPNTNYGHASRIPGRQSRT